MNELTDEEIERYGRQIIVPGVGGAGQLKLKAGSVLVIGAGGLGSPALLYLAAAGVGRIGVVDGDVVDVTNLQRQIAHTSEDIGRSKVESAAEKMRAINPHIKIETYPERFSAENAFELVDSYDVVIDGSDNFPTRYLINDACVLRGKPLVSAAILRSYGQTLTIMPGVGPCYRCVFPVAPEPGSVPSCSQAGILGPVAGVMGSLQALEALKLLMGLEGLLVGRFVAFDLAVGESHEMQVERRPDCQVCGDKPSIVSLTQERDSCSA